MNKSMKKVTALVLTLALVMGMIIVPSYASGSDIGDTGKQWVTVHKTNGDPDYSGVGFPPPAVMESKLEIKDAMNNLITPNGSGVYENIPAGAKLELTYAFSLADGDGISEVYNYEKDDFFKIALPQGITFDAPLSGTITADHAGVTYDLVNWEIDTPSTHVTFKLTDEAAKDDVNGLDEKSARWGKLTITGTFSPLSEGDPEETQIVFGTDIITVKREPLPTESTLTKSGNYDVTTNEITWTVGVEVPKGDTGLSYKGFTVIDEYSINQEFVPGSFEVGGAAIADSTLDIDEGLDPHSIKYTFTSDTTGNQTITYKTKPKEFDRLDGKENGESEHKNTVSLKRGEDSAADSQTATVLLDWFEKSGNVTTESTDTADIMKWTIKVHIPGTAGDSLTGARVVDILHKDLKLIQGDSAHPITITIGSFTDTPILGSAKDGDYEYVTDDTNGDTFTYYFPSGNQPEAGTEAILTFYTEAKNKDAFLGSNVAINVANTAMLLWDNSDDLTKAPTYTYNTTGQGTGIGGGGLLNKTSPGEKFIYNPTSNTIKWTIYVNSHEITMPKAVIVDTIPSGQELLIDNLGHEFIVSSSSEVNQTITSNANDGVFASGGNNAFTLNLGNITKKHTITYYTKITDFDALYKNGSIPYNNGVKLTYTGGEVEETGNKEFDSQMLNKRIPTGGGYNYNTHLMKWEIVVNRNKLPLANATITDTLPVGMVLEIDATHKFEVSPDTGVTHDAVHEGADFVVTLPAATSEQYTITFWTRLTDVALKEQWSGTKPFKNTAVLSQDGKDDVTHSATANIRNPFVLKSHKYTKGDDTIHWAVEVNRAQVAITNGEVVDLLNEALQLNPDSVKLFKANVQANATDPLIKGTEVTKNASAATDTEFSTTISKVGNQDQLSVYLPTPTKEAYILEFDTIIVEDSIDLQNKVSISGSGGGADSTYSSGSVVVNNLYSSGGSGSNTLTVIKKDSAGNLLKDAEFRLTNAGKLPITSGGKDITKETDGNGEANFESLPSWTFYVEETEPSPGYLIPSDPYAYGVKLSGDQIVMVINAKALADVAFTKVGAEGKLLTSGTFTLTGDDINDNPVNETAIVDANGIVKFTNIPINKAGTKYIIKETAAPSGHVISLKEIEAEVLYSSDYKSTVVKLDGVVVTDDSTKFINIPDKIDVEFTKQGFDENGNTVALSGGKFTLTGQDYNGNPVTIPDIAAVGVKVTFPGVQIGIYEIMEVEAPYGYLLPSPSPAKIFDVKVEYKDDKTGLVADLTRLPDSTKANIYVDKKGLADISFTKVDSRDGVTLLSGGLFELSGTDYKGDPYVQKAPSVGGTVTFTGVPIDDGSDYTIKELSSPSGYKLTTETLDASVRYPVVGGVTDYTKVEGKITSTAKKLENDKSKKVVPKTGMLMISKKVTGNAGDKSKKFTFTVTFSDKAQSFEYFGSLGNGTIKSGDKIQLAHGESITIVEITEGVTYTVVEDDYTSDGYKHGPLSVKGTIEEDVMATAAFINDKHDEDLEEEGVLGDTDEKDPGKPGGEDGDVLGDDARLPKTGDDFMPAVWAAGLIASLLGIWYVLRRRSSFGEE